MWSAITAVEFPASLDEAFRLHEAEKKVFCSGGSYLAAERPVSIHTLIDISRLLSQSVVIQGTRLSIDAGISLQKLADEIGAPHAGELAECAIWSCPSRNIRNQRTLGGEIARGRVDSELFACLNALNPILHIHAGSEGTVQLRDWEGTGIITSVEIDLGLVNGIAVQRFALLPSAPAFVIVIGVSKGDSLQVTVAGRAEQVTCFEAAAGELPEKTAAQFAETAISHFQSDQYGSLDYKRLLIRTALTRIGTKL